LSARAFTGRNSAVRAPGLTYAYFVALGASAVLVGALGLLRWCVVFAYRYLRGRTRPRLRRARIWLGLALGGSITVWASAKVGGASVPYAAIDVRMLGAYRPAAGASTSVVLPPYLLLAGDLHCHVSPPDDAYHVSRDLAATLELASSEGLDFIVLTPHIWTPYLKAPGYRERILADHRWLTAELSRVDLGRLLVTAGAESTDDAWGHVGMAFGDFDRALREMTDTEVDTNLGAFFQRYVDSGGLLTLNHPLARPQGLTAHVFSVDVSWRPFTRQDLEYPNQIQVADRLAIGVEAYNLGVSELRDFTAFGDRETSIREVLLLLDGEIVRRQRRLVPVGGSDSHGFFMRPVLFVLATERSLAGVHEAIARGRTCVRDSAACSLLARKPGEAWQPLGSAISNTESVEVRASADAVLYRGGSEQGRLQQEEVRTVPTPRGACSLLRVSVGAGYSAPIYVNCPFAE
jgi:hypothetical protein